MKRQWLRLLVTLALMLLSGCTRTVTFTIPSNSPVQVSVLGESNSYTLTLTDTQFSQLGAWVEHNQTGWSSYLATTPIRGILVTGQAFWLQFIDSSAIVHIAEGTFTKSVAPS